jgi:hypothetical protein
MVFRIVFWDVLPCKMIVDRRFRGASIHNHFTRSTSQKTILNIPSPLKVLNAYNLHSYYPPSQVSQTVTSSLQNVPSKKFVRYIHCRSSYPFKGTKNLNILETNRAWRIDVVETQRLLHFEESCFRTLSIV